MIKIAFLTSSRNLPWNRQFPKGIPKINGVEFFVPTDQADIVFVYDALPQRKVAIKSSQKAIFIASEPETVKRYQPGFLAQFDTVITTDRATPHPHRIFSQTGLPWFVGSNVGGDSPLQNPMPFEELENHFPNKTKLISVVSSDKVFTPEHRARLEFVSRLREAFGDQIDIFGRGIADFDDKRDVLDTYRYHIALENCSVDDYWTEKLADPFLTLTFPIYHGCPNISHYFSELALAKIDIGKPDEAIAIIKRIIESDLSEQRLGELVEARRRILYEHNIFFMIAKFVSSAQQRDPFLGSCRPLLAEESWLSFAQRAKLVLLAEISKKPRIRKALRLLRKKLSQFFLNSKP